MDKAALAEAATALGALGPVTTDVVELTDETSVAAATAQTVSRHGRIDILVNNAGITGGNAKLWELEPTIWRQVIEVNLVAPYLVCRAVVPEMLKSGYGRIVNIASIAGKEGNPNLALFRLEGGADRAHEIAGQGARDLQHPRELHHAGCREDRDLRPDEA